jgi:hypothetical protein
MREVEAELFQDGRILRLVARVSARVSAPPLPLSNGAPRSLPRVAGRLGAASVRVETKLLVPWLLSVLKRMDAQRGQYVADALDVVKWNVGLDARGDVVEQVVGPFDIAVDGAAGTTRARARARVADRERLLAALVRLSGFAYVLGGDRLSVKSVTFEGARGFALSSPALGLHAAVALERRQITAVVSPAAVPADWRRRAGTQDSPRGAGRWDALALVGPVNRCAHAVIDCAAVCEYLAEVAGSRGAVADAVEMIRAFGRARGSAALAVSVDGADLTLWGAWVPDDRGRADELPGRVGRDMLVTR